MSTCAACGGELPPAAKFCPACGLTQSTSCGSCGAGLVGGAAFCHVCGAGQAAAAPTPSPPVPAAARRVTSVLFGDLVGFTSLSEVRDQEEVRELLSRYFEECRVVVQRYGGTLEKFIGDAVMAVWGVPTAHEDDAERAVRAGLELVAAVAGLRDEVGIPGLDMRVGIVTGEVAVTVGATGQGMVAGDPVNTASRVQSAAAPGEVWVDETTRLLTHAAITYADAGSHVLKGKADPVPLWSVRAVVANLGGSQRADGLEAPLVARDRELRLVKELFHRTEESATPSLLLVSSEPGLGKTRLGWEFSKYTDGLSSTVRWLEGRCPAYGDSVAYFALAEAIRGRLRSLGEDEDEDLPTEQLVERGLAAYVPEESEHDWLRTRLAALLGAGDGASFAQQDLFAAWVRFLELLATDSSALVLLVDDAQNADDGFIDFLELALQVDGLPLFVLLLARDELLHEHPRLATNRRVTVLNLGPLTDPDMARLLAGLVHGIPESVRRGLVLRSDGVPLFAIETIRSLIDRDLVVPRGGQYVLADPDIDVSRLGAPASMQALIASRLDALDPLQRRVVDDASVLGLDFAPETLQVLTGEDVPDLDRVIDGLVRRQILSRDSNPLSGGYGRYGFVQDVVRQVAYGMLSRRDRRAAHLRVAEHLGSRGPDLAAVTARHLVDAAQAVPEESDVAELEQQAIALLCEAGLRARNLGLPAEARDRLQLARDLCRDPLQRADVEVDLCRALGSLRAFDEILVIASQALALLDQEDEVRAAQAAASLGFVHNQLGRDREVVELLEPWWDRLGGRSDADEALVEVGVFLSSAYSGLGNHARALPTSLAALAAAERLGEPRPLAQGLARYGEALQVAGHHRLARGAFRLVIEHGESQRQPEYLVDAYAKLALLELAGDLPEALALVERVDEVVQTHRLFHMHDWAELFRLEIHFVTGDWTRLDPRFADFAENVEPTEQATYDLIGLWLATARGEAIEEAGPASDDDYVGLVRRAVALTRQGRSQEAARLACRAAHRLTRREALGGERTTPVMDGLLDLVAGGDADQLRELLDLLPPESDRSVPRAVVAWRTRLRGHLALAEGVPEEAELHWRAATAAYRDWGADLMARRTEVHLARLLLEQGRAEEAGALLSGVRQVYRRIGATAWWTELPAPVPEPG